VEDSGNDTFTVSGTATSASDFPLNLNSFSYVYRLANSQCSLGVKDTSGTEIEKLIPNTSLDVTISGSGIILTGGQTRTLRTIAGSAGNFDVVATVLEPSSAARVRVIGTLVLFPRRRRR